ncbi:MAG: CHASE2 domain-containing protein, partial [Gammaproteobacteria bacterium]|nr:CHASE2 domain-containing protein [Gammaproteobacteria bacterium]
MTSAGNLSAGAPAQGGALRDRLRRYATSMGLGVVLALAISQTSLYERADLWLGDAFMRTLAPADRFDGVAVVDVDEDSMTALESQLGAWPYARQIYAVVGEFLARAGAQAVVYDVLFSEAREGDAEFGASLQGQPVALAAAALPQLIERSRGHGERIAALAWPAAPEVPRRYWPDITLPVVELAPGGAGVGVGVVTLLPDPVDGVVRRMPLLHGVQDAVLPALPLAALHARGAKPRVEFSAGRIRVGERAWPVNASSEAVLRFPARPEGLQIVPFYEVVLAALDRPKYAHVAARVRGKIVVVGSSAMRLGDYVQTPMGRTQGVVVTAMAVEMLREGRVLKPSAAGWNGLLLAIAMLVPALGFHSRLGKLSALIWIGAPLSAVLVLGAAALLFVNGQQASILFAVLVSVL